MNQKHEKEIKSKISDLDFKIKAIRDGNENLSNALSDAFTLAITTEITVVMDQLQDFKINYTKNIEADRDRLVDDFTKNFNTLLNKFDNHINNVTKLFDQRLEEIEKATAAFTEKRKKNIEILENMKMAFTYIVFISVALILVRALTFGIWEGLFIKNFYEWGIQWAWLKYTMWGLFAGISGAILWVIFKFIKSNFKYNS